MGRATLALLALAGCAGAEAMTLPVPKPVPQTVAPPSEVGLNPGETKTVTFVLKPDQMAIWNAKMKREIEPGKFEVMIGASSDDIKLRGLFTEK